MPVCQREATIEVAGEQVSMAAYWRAVELIQCGESDERITAAIRPLLRTRNYMKTRSIVDGIKQNLILMQQEPSGTYSYPNYDHLRNVAQFSTYRHQRLQIRQDLEIATSKLDRAVVEEKQLTFKILDLKRYRGKDGVTSQSEESDRRTEGRIKGQIIALQEERDDVRRQIASLKQIMDVNEASLA